MPCSQSNIRRFSCHRNYQFDDSRHWLELKAPSQTLAFIGAPKVKAIEEKFPDTLLTFLSYQDGEIRLARFRINTTIPLYDKFVVGHVIAQTAPICPSIVEYSDEYRGLQKLVAHGSHSVGYVTRKQKTLSGSVDNAFMTEAVCQVGGIRELHDRPIPVRYLPRHRR